MIENRERQPNALVLKCWLNSVNSNITGSGKNQFAWAFLITPQMVITG